jgi:hypothetical protein
VRVPASEEFFWTSRRAGRAYTKDTREKVDFWIFPSLKCIIWASLLDSGGGTFGAVIFFQNTEASNF